MSLTQELIDGLSTGNLTTDELVTPLPAVTTRSDPTEVLSTQGVFGEGSRSIVIPPDRPPYYFKIDLARYTRRSWREVGDLDFQGSIVLPIPNSIVDAQAVDWSGEEIGIVGAAAMSLMGGTYSSWSDIWDDVKNSGGGVAKYLRHVGARGAGGVFESSSQGALAGQGIAINNYLTMMLKGPTYKTHSFTWVFSPETPEESETLARMYRVTNNASAPAIFDTGYTGAAFFQYPMIFKLSFNHDEADMGSVLHRFKPAVLTKNVWNFTPRNSPAFFSQSRAPQSVEVSMEFAELEFWLAGDYR